MAEKRDYYEILGVSKTATKEELKKAYRKLAIQYHPDRQQGKSDEEKKAAEEKFKEAAEAYDVLSDDTKRQRYDQFGHAGVGGAGNGGFSDVNDIFSHFGDIFGDFFGGGSFGGGFGGFGGSRGQAVRKGSNLRVRVKLDLSEIVNGVEKKIKIRKKVTCPDCGGSGAASSNDVKTCPDCKGTGYVIRMVNGIFGRMQQQSACPHCNGEGKIITNKCSKCKGEGVVDAEETVTVKIPAGVAEGMQLNVQGKGNAPRHGGVNGDLLVQILEESHPDFERDGNDLVYDLNISFPDAVLGATVEIPTVESPVKIKIEEGTQSGKILRLRGKGIPDVNGYGRGDLLVNVQVFVPKDVTKEERKLLEKLQESDSFRPKNKSGFFDRMKDFFE
ncbi:MAG: molecular chaperone DnaJ [Bacteroidales bacterium]|nr:molecular chaperone DnaJ [Bacteroidales bacterium]